MGFPARACETGICMKNTAASSHAFRVSLFLTVVWLMAMCAYFYDGNVTLINDDASRNLAKAGRTSQNVLYESEDDVAIFRLPEKLPKRSDQPDKALEILRLQINHSSGPHDRGMKAKNVPQHSFTECTFPGSDPFGPYLLNISKMFPSLDCSKNTANIVYLENFVVKVNSSKLHLVLSPGQNFSHCWCKEISRKNGTDKAFEYTWTSDKFTESLALESWQENVVAECFDSRPKAISRSYFPLIRIKQETETYLKENYHKHLQANTPLETLSILMIGIDGMSKQNFERAMPKTRNFLVEKMGAIELYKYNKIAFDTFPNVLALLTGHTIKEFYTDWGYNRTEFLDQINEAFLWTEARKLGYRTALILDSYDITAFHYQKKGFKVSPVDYYQRATVMASTRDGLMRGNNSHCAGDVPDITRLHDYWLQMAATFGKDKTTPFFAYSFAARLTHDDSDFASKGDEAYLKFLQDLVATDSLDNTVIVWFSDHGPRFGPIRETYYGRIETSTPYLFLVFPTWFERKYPKRVSRLKINQNRLTSHFDVYKTLHDLLYFKEENLSSTAEGSSTGRAISLFREIPQERTCDSAGIPAEFCACGHFSRPKLSQSVLNQLGDTLLNRINTFLGFGAFNRPGSHSVLSNSSRDFNSESSSSPPAGAKSNLGPHSQLEGTNSFSDGIIRSTMVDGDRSQVKCVPLLLVEVESVYLVTNDQLRSLKSKPYRVTIRTAPGAGLFEGLVSNEMGGKSHVMGDVVRINMYRGQADCVHDPWLRQFCYCL